MLDLWVFAVRLMLWRKAETYTWVSRVVFSVPCELPVALVDWELHEGSPRNPAVIRVCPDIRALDYGVLLGWIETTSQL